MGIRRPHTKSRKGCLQCKQKHTKCDEKRPSCQVCIKFERQCSFLEERSRQHASTSQASKFTAAPPERPPNETVLSHEEELFLMHQWTSSTYQALSQNTQYMHIWQITVMKEAFAHRFLLDGIFALTCLDLCYHDTDAAKRRHYLHTALEYQNRAVGPFKHALKNIGPSNCHAAYISAIVTMMLRFALPGAHVGVPDHEISNPKESIIETALLLTGVSTVSVYCREHLESGSLTPLFVTPPDMEVPAAGLKDDEEEAFQNMYSLVVADDGIASHEKPVYIASLGELRKSFYLVQTEAGSSSIMKWLVCATRVELLPLFQMGDTMAVLIVMHWAVLLHTLNDEWWARDWGRRLVLALTYDLKGRALKEGWVSSIEWVHTKVDLSAEDLTRASASDSNYTPSMAGQEAEGSVASSRGCSNEILSHFLHASVSRSRQSASW